MESYFNGCTEFQFRRVKSSEVDDGENCTTMCMYLAPLNCAVKYVKIVYFILCDFYHNKKIQMACSQVSLTSRAD